MITCTITDKSGVKPKSLILVNLSKLSRITGYHKSHLSRVFAKKTAPSVPCLSAIAEATGLTLDETWAKVRGSKFRTSRNWSGAIHKGK